VAATHEISTADGGRMGAHLSLPAAGQGPGLLVLMEIFGVGPYIRRATERLAELGYVAMAPDLYRRIAPGIEFGHDADGMARAMETSQRLDPQGAVEDSLAALAALGERPEVGGRAVGVLGFCLGGTLAYEVAVAGDPALAVCYYGSGIPDRLDQAGRIACPVLLHFGAQDEYIPRERAERVCEVAEAREGWECHIQPDAGHAFDNHESEMFHRPEAAARAWEITRGFLARHLPAG
jgi:carboxymethylenebutenolidase